MAPPLLHLDGIRLSFGGEPLLDGAELIVAPGERIALVGRNGSGKSTLLKIAAGLVEPQDGTVFRHPDATVRYLEQVPSFDGHADLLSYVRSSLGPADDPYRADYLIGQLGLDSAARPENLSGGEARRAALARVLAPEPDILLLDEPTNHLDIAAIEWLEGELARRQSAMVIISHDRRFLESISRATVWLDRGVTRRLERGFAHFEQWRDETLEKEERDAEKLARRIVAEEHWLRYGVTARRKRNMRRLGALHAMREELRTRNGPQGNVRLSAQEGQESGKLVIEAEGISKSFDGRLLVAPFSIRIHRGDRVGFAGPNGAGKTTLLKMLTGALAPDTGTVRIGTNLVTATFDQRQESLDPGQTVQDYLTGGRGDQILVGDSYRHVVSYMKDFLFLPAQARQPVGRLSGGERARLVLARILAQPSNLLVLDEPTNDLDMETLDLLQEVVAGYAGTVLLISHDRDFLDRTVTSLIVPEQDGRWIAYAGGYSDMLAQRGPREAPPAKAPDRARAPARAEARPAGQRKLSYKQKFALERLPVQIEEVGAALGALEEKLADPQLFATDPEGFQRLAQELERKRAELAALEEEWLELEILREELES